MAKFETDENVRERNLNHTDAEHDTISDDSVKNETNSKFNINIINSEVILHTSLTSEIKGKTEPEQSQSPPTDFRFENINQAYHFKFMSEKNGNMESSQDIAYNTKLSNDHQFRKSQTDLSTPRYCPCCGESYPFPKVLCPNCYSWECRACGHKRMAHIANLLCPKCSSPDFEVSIEKEYVVDIIEKLRKKYENDLKKQSGLLRSRNRMC